MVQVDWTPPAGGRPELLAALEKTVSVEKANAAVLEKILSAEPVLADVKRAGELVPALDGERLMLHAGPPIEWARASGPLRGALMGAAVLEELVADPRDAVALFEAGTSVSLDIPDLAGAERISA